MSAYYVEVIKSCFVTNLNHTALPDMTSAHEAVEYSAKNGVEVATVPTQIWTTRNATKDEVAQWRPSLIGACILASDNVFFVQEKNDNDLTNTTFSDGVCVPFYGLEINITDKQQKRFTIFSTYCFFPDT
ncbi:hypothetical protein ScPMuIL_014926 [Solemya velum]